jgi:hypothetical protein
MHPSILRFHQCRALREMADEEIKMNNWISVKKSLPYLFERVLVFGKYGIFTGYLTDVDSQEWCLDPGTDLIAVGVTHWMDLPESPEMGNE